MKTTFKVFVTKDISEHATFAEAFKAFYEKVLEMAGKGELNERLLETYCWIEGRFTVEDETCELGVCTYELKEFAYSVGLLTQDLEAGKASLADPLPDVPLDKVFTQFSESGYNEFLKYINTVQEINTLVESLPPKEGDSSQPS